MKQNIFHIALFFCFAIVAQAQHSTTIRATLVPENNTVLVTQELTYHNTSEDILSEIFLHDWANSFATKTTPLAKRFS